jgi:hypothetical protein
MALDLDVQVFREPTGDDFAEEALLRHRAFEDPRGEGRVRQSDTKVKTT